MDALQAPIERVVERAEWFVRTPSLRLLHIITSEAARVPVLQHLTAAEMLEQNTCPFFVLEAPTEPQDDGWSARSEELRLDWKLLAESAPEGTRLPSSWPEQRSDSSLSRFALELGQALSRCSPPTMTGLVIVLAPVWVTDGAHFLVDLEALVTSAPLAHARFIVVETATEHALPLVDRLGDHATRADARVDEHALRKEANARIRAMQTAPPGATGPRLMGAAGPSIAPPVDRRRRDLTPEQQRVAAQSAGLAPIHFDVQAMQQYACSVLLAAAAFRDGNVEAALEHQYAARGFCERHGLQREAIVHQLVLAGHVLQAGEPKLALDQFREASQSATDASFYDLGVQAQMGAGACLVLLGQPETAATTYFAAAQLGSQHQVAPELTVECYRTAGQLLMSIGRTAEAATTFRRGLEAADSAAANVVKSSSAREIMRELASHYRHSHMFEQAIALEEQAAALDESEVTLTEQEGGANDQAPPSTKPH